MYILTFILRRALSTSQKFVIHPCKLAPAQKSKFRKKGKKQNPASTNRENFKRKKEKRKEKKTEDMYTQPAIRFTVNYQGNFS